MERKVELFNEIAIQKGCSIVNPCVNFYKQERDWTCSVTCIRSLISCYQEHNYSEDDILKMEKLKIGGQDIKDIINWDCLKNVEKISHLEKSIKSSNDLYDLLLDGYAVMCITTYNWWHYVIAYGYLTTNDKIKADEQMILLYDPYYDEHKIMRVDLFESMWYNQDTKKWYEYIAVK